MKWRRLTFVLILALVWSGVSATTALSQERTSIQFLSVAPDEETQKADQKLLDYLRGKIPLTFEGQDLKYEAAVDTLRNWDANKQGPLLARVTPYVYVVAEMLGANMEVVGIYLSKKSKRVTSNHYFVVHKDFGYEREEAPEDFVRHVNNPETQTQDFVQLLKQREFQARFVYPSRYSTSGHFLPSLFFKKQGIFALPSQSKTNPKFITIHGLVPESAMTVADLIPLVKKQKIDFVAVRESIKNRFEADEDLKFIQLPYTTPNDLLVVIKPFYPAIKTQILEALRKMEVNAIDQGDILKWVDFNASPKARKSLANLQRLAKAIPHPVVINIRKSQKENTGIEEQHLEAARQAVRSAGPEMVLFNEDDHSAFDVLWTLDTKHDHSLQLTSTILDSGLTQEFSVVYRQGDMEHLAAQIRRVIEQKMHRIRYIWLIDNDTPRVLRDVDFQIPVGQPLKVQKITWLNFNTHEYNVDTPFKVTVTQSDFHSFQLEGKGLPKKENGKYGFEPLGNVAYRVFL
ncbi:MAG: PhnD/SsuA/transferrin family substrate-binding protein, partial [Nitrospinae bacterium]|nr:PhnD/SsuA/transferrin family substrate-binding protein [Nitrospinota bacterium]